MLTTFINTINHIYRYGEVLKSQTKEKRLRFSNLPRLALLVGGIVFSTGSFGKSVIAEPISRTQKHCQKSADMPLESGVFIKNLLEKQIPFNIVINEEYRRFCGENGLDPRNI